MPTLSLILPRVIQKWQNRPGLLVTAPPQPGLLVTAPPQTRTVSNHTRKPGLSVTTPANPDSQTVPPSMSRKSVYTQTGVSQSTRLSLFFEILTFLTEPVCHSAGVRVQPVCHSAGNGVVVGARVMGADTVRTIPGYCAHPPVPHCTTRDTTVPLETPLYH